MKRCRLFAFLNGPAAMCAAWIIAPDSAICQDGRKSAKLSSEVQHCQSAKKDPRGCPARTEILADLRIYLSNRLSGPEPGSLLAHPIRRAVPTRSRSRKSQTQLDLITRLPD